MRRTHAAFIGFACLASVPARAHEATTGIAGLVDGATQIVLYPNLAFALVVAAVATSAMRRGVALSAAVALVLGCVAGTLTPPLPALLWLMPALLGTAGAIAVILIGTARMPRPLAEGLALVMGWATGLATVPTHGGPAAMVASVTGTIGAAVLAIGLLAGLLAVLRRLLAPRVGDLALRVIGAWILAITIMMLALAFAPPATTLVPDAPVTRDPA